MNLYKKLAIASLSFIATACGGGDGNGYQSTPPVTGSITVKMEVADLPALLDINNPNTSASSVEYGWFVTFDVNNDGIYNEGDVGLTLVSFKTGTTASVSPSTFQSKVYEVQPGSAIKWIADSTVSITTNVITLSVNKSANSLLEKVNASTRVYCSAIGIDNSGIQHWDYLPGFESYIDASADGNYPDSPNDVTTDPTILTADILSAQVIIN